MGYPQVSISAQNVALRDGQYGAEMQAVPEKAVSTQPESHARRGLPIVQLAFALSIICLLIAGWQWRDAEYTVADEGLGYALGIVGGVMMLALLLYPVRKKAGFMRGWGALRHWFRWHMLFGILGPVAILFHCNFHLGATNSNVALFCMLTVAGSGLIGRYVYTKIHHGLYGARATLDELQARSGLIEGDVQGALAQAPEVVRQIQAFHALAVRPYRGVVAGLATLLVLGIAAYYRRYRAMAALRRWVRQQAIVEGWDRRMAKQRLTSQRQLVERCIASLREVAEFSAYERLFALWHVLHIPLFFMLVLAGIVHVFAVNIY